VCAWCWRATSLRKRMPMCSRVNQKITLSCTTVGSIRLWVALFVLEAAFVDIAQMLTTPLRCVLLCAQV
jgi:hypothetical protein